MIYLRAIVNTLIAVILYHIGYLVALLVVPEASSLEYVIACGVAYLLIDNINSCKGVS